MNEHTPHDERALADAIRLGIQHRPQQAFGEYFQGRRRSCALGAAYEGIYRMPQDVAGFHPHRLDRLFECLDFSVRACPAGCRKRIALGALIVHLNDTHEWTREQIADWVQSLAPASGAPGAGAGASRPSDEKRGTTTHDEPRT
ncbi:MAG: hypothetical protein U0Q12_17550 [Vicinamibacterales bacterium]